MADKATPTITLAELYENQNQYIDALVIYKNLYKEDPTEELQSKIDELKDKIFKENTLEYSTIIDKIFTNEEKRIFHILPHEQFNAYKESQAELKNEETFPEELVEEKKEKVTPLDEEELKIDENTLNIDDIDEDLMGEKELIPKNIEELEIEKDEALDINNTTELEEKIDLEESIELDDTKNIEETEKPQIEEEIPDIDDTTKPEEKIGTEETIEIEDTLDSDDKIEDDLSLEIDEEISDDLDKSEIITESNIQSDDINSIEDLEEINKQVEQNEIIDNDDEVETILKPPDENQILNLLTALSNLRPDIVERVLKENVGSDRSLAEIKLSDLNFVVELLKVSNNVEKE